MKGAINSDLGSKEIFTSLVIFGMCLNINIYQSVERAQVISPRKNKIQEWNKGNIDENKANIWNRKKNVIHMPRELFPS